MDAANSVVSLWQLYKVHVGFAAFLLVFISLDAVYHSGAHRHVDIYAGDANCRLAVTKNKECEQSYKAGPESEAYLNCKRSLEKIVRKIITDDLMDLNKCVLIEGRPKAVLCKIYTFFVPKTIVVTDELIVSFVKKRNGVFEKEVKKSSVTVDGKGKPVELTTYKEKHSRANSTH